MKPLNTTLLLSGIDYTKYYIDLFGKLVVVYLAKPNSCLDAGLTIGRGATSKKLLLTMVIIGPQAGRS